MDSPSSTFSFKQLPWAGLLALVLVVGLERRVFGDIDFWREAKVLIRGHKRNRVFVEAGLINDMLELNQLSKGAADEKRVIVFGNSRALDGVIFPARQKDFRVARVTHAPLSPFFARTFAERALANGVDLFVYPLAQHETHKPVRVLAMSSYGSPQGLLDVFGSLGLDRIWKRRVELERLVVATLFDSYRYRDILDLCWLNDFRKLRAPKKKRSKQAEGAPISVKGKRADRGARALPTFNFGKRGANSQGADLAAGIKSRGQASGGARRAAASVEKGHTAEQAEPIVAATLAQPAIDRRRFPILGDKKDVSPGKMPKIKNLEQILQDLEGKVQNPRRVNLIRSIHEVRSGRHVSSQTQLLTKTIQVLREAGCEVLLVEVPINPLADPLYDAQGTNAEFLLLAQKLVSEQGVHFLTAEESGPFPATDFSDLLHLKKARGYKLGALVMGRINQILSDE